MALGNVVGITKLKLIRVGQLGYTKEGHMYMID